MLQFEHIECRISYQLIFLCSVHHFSFLRPLTIHIMEKERWNTASMLDYLFYFTIKGKGSSYKGNLPRQTAIFETPFKPFQL